MLRAVEMEKLLDIPSAAEVLSVPEQWLRKAVSAKKVPYTRIGKHVRFRPAHIAAIISAGEQEPVVAAQSRGTARSRL